MTVTWQWVRKIDSNRVIKENNIDPKTLDIPTNISCRGPPETKLLNVILHNKE